MRNLSVVAVLLLVGCFEQGPGPKPPPTDTDKCDAAEQQLRTLKCHDRQGRPMWVNLDGEPFGRTCRIAQEEGRVSVNPTCISTAKTCEETNRCPMN